jgi:hypothetical protein
VGLGAASASLTVEPLIQIILPNPTVLACRSPLETAAIQLRSECPVAETDLLSQAIV